MELICYDELSTTGRKIDTPLQQYSGNAEHVVVDGEVALFLSIDHPNGLTEGLVEVESGELEFGAALIYYVQVLVCGIDAETLIGLKDSLHEA